MGFNIRSKVNKPRPYPQHGADKGARQVTARVEAGQYTDAGRGRPQNQCEDRTKGKQTISHASGFNHDSEVLEGTQGMQESL
jgi:hypothetical protein